jgi:hypothetical protein
MTTQVSSEVSAVIDGLIADRQVASTDLFGVPQEITAAVQAAGFQSLIGTIAFAGQNANGSFSVQYNVQKRWRVLLRVAAVGFLSRQGRPPRQQAGVGGIQRRPVRLQPRLRPYPAVTDLRQLVAARGRQGR